MASSKSLDNITIASTVMKLDNGYLVSIVPKRPNVDIDLNTSERLKKYIKIFKEKKSSVFHAPVVGGFVVPVEKEDFKFIETKFDFALDRKITIFSDFHYDIVQGDKYYVIIEPLGTTSIKDVCVFIKRDDALDKKRLIWAKNYEEGDESIRLSDSRISDMRTVVFSKEVENVVRRIHMKILDQLSTTKSYWLDKSPLSVNFKNVNEYNEVIYETKLFPGQRSYVAEVNGKSTFDRISFYLGMILDENLDHDCPN